MRSPSFVPRVPRLLTAVIVLAAGCCVMGAMPAAAQSNAASRSSGAAADPEVEKRIQDLEKQIQQLRTDTRVLEVSDEERKRAKPQVGYQDGFFLTSTDGKSYRLRLNGYAQADSRFATDDSENPTVNSFQIRRARLDIRGTVAERFDFRIMPDFAGSQLVLFDAYADARFAPWAVLRVGKFKVPYGLERLQSATSLNFIERSLADNLVPNRDVGVGLFGDVHRGEVNYAVAVTNGVPDGGNGDADVNDAVDVVGRLFTQPFLNTAYEPLRNLGFGVAASYGKEQGTASSTQLPVYRTSSRNIYFRYVSDNPATAGGTTVASGDRWRVSPQAWYYYGPFGALFDYAMTNQEMAKGAVTATTFNTAWELQGMYVLTGERPSFQGVVPNNNFDFGRGGWGAWALLFRYANLNVDGETFTKGFADPTKSVSEIDSYTAGLNWYLNRNILFQLNYEHSDFEKGVKTGNRDPENVFLTRVQFLF